MGWLFKVLGTPSLGILRGYGPPLFPHSCPRGPVCPQRGGSCGIPDALSREVTSLESPSSRCCESGYPGRVLLSYSLG